MYAFPKNIKKKLQNLQQNDVAFNETLFQMTLFLNEILHFYSSKLISISYRICIVENATIAPELLKHLAISYTKRYSYSTQVKYEIEFCKLLFRCLQVLRKH